MAKSAKSAKSAVAVAVESINPSAAQVAFDAIKAAIATRGEVRKDHAAKLARYVKDFNVAQAQVLVDCEIDVPALCERLAIASADDNKGAFVALYAVEKIFRLIKAVAQSSIAQCDPHTATVLLNSHRLQVLTSKSAQVAMSRNVEYSETDIIQAIQRFGGKYEPSTASTQLSSTRALFAALGVAEVNKGQRNEAISLGGSILARKLDDMCAAFLSRSVAK